MSVLRADGMAAGAGLLIAERRILTCAHVVNEALGRPVSAQEAPSGADLLVYFPALGGPGQRRAARVKVWLPPPRPGAAGDDIAGLLLGDNPPGGAVPGRLGVEPARAGETSQELRCQAARSD